MEKRRMYGILLCVILTGLAGCSAPAGEETQAQVETQMEPESASQEGRETTEYEKDGVHFVFQAIPFEEKDAAGKTWLEGAYMTAEISIEGNEEAAAKIQNTLNKQVEDFLTEKAQNLENAQEDGMVRSGDMSYSMYEGLTVQDITGDIISLTVSGEQYLGGAHGFYWTTGLNFDRHTGKELTLEGLFENPDEAVQKMKEVVLAQMQERSEEAGEELFFPDMEDTVEELIRNGSWYFQDGNIVVIANVYDLAPYVAGAFEFPVPLSELGYKMQMQ